MRKGWNALSEIAEAGGLPPPSAVTTGRILRLVTGGIHCLDGRCVGRIAQGCIDPHVGSLKVLSFLRLPFPGFLK